MSLIDRGANGGVAGSDVRVIFKTHRSVDIKGIDKLNDVSVGTVGGIGSTQKGPVIAIMHASVCLTRQRFLYSLALST
jgi:hypothetical protein